MYRDKVEPETMVEQERVTIFDDFRRRYEPEEEAVFSDWLHILNDAGVSYVLGGAIAVYAYTGIWRDTKDLDIFLKPSDVERALAALSAAGYRTELTDAKWLAKVHREPYFMDLIFGVGNNRFKVNDTWLERGHDLNVLGAPARMISIEELIASKVYIVKRDRFDGADIVHLIVARKGCVDWAHVRRMLGDDSDLLLYHLIMFHFVYPGHADHLPQALMVELFERMRAQWATVIDPKAFRGTLLDPISFAVDCQRWGYEDRFDQEPLVKPNGEAA
jgi:predicted nucleotidyltransferase